MAFISFTAFILLGNDFNRSGDRRVMFQFSQAMHYNDTWSWCVLPAGLLGALQLFPPLSLTLPSIFTFYPAPHILSSLCSVTLSLLSLPVFLVPMCSLITASLPGHTHTHPSTSKAPTLSFGGHPFFYIQSPLFPTYIFAACPLFCSGVLIDFENCTLPPLSLCAHL